MKRKTWVGILLVAASWIVIIFLVWAILKLLGVIPLTRTYTIEENTPIAEAAQIQIQTDTIDYWLTLASSTKNSWSLPPYLTGVPRDRIMPNLISCESGGDPMAINPVDRDGTASIGLLEFKPETLYTNAIKYGLLSSSTPKSEIMKVIYNAQLQIDVASYMIENNWHSVSWWAQQFPSCAKKHNYWQQVIMKS
jgi:hypothetical protein